MANLRIRSTSEQVAAHLRSELAKYSRDGQLTGSATLAKDLGVNHKAVEAALQQLEREGLLTNQGPRRRRKIRQSDSGGNTSLRLGILPASRDDLHVNYMVELQSQLDQAGHRTIPAPRPLNELNLRKICQMVESTNADAWIVMAGSREILEWFAQREQPTFALFGRRGGLPIAGISPDKKGGILDATQRLIQLGHRRIVMIALKLRRLPTPGEVEQSFLDELEKHGIMPSAYNLPDWEESPAGLHQRLDSMLQITPPTALIVDEAPVFLSVQQYLAKRNIFAPRDISLVCTDGDPYFDWLKPAVAHIAWRSEPVIRRVVQWANHMSAGHKDLRQSNTATRFIEGGTIGPPPIR